MTPSKVYTVTIVHTGEMSCIPVPFDPKAIFGKVRAPVTVTVNGYTYRSTIAAMGGPPAIPLRRSHREAAGVSHGDVVEVRLTLDTAKREVTPRLISSKPCGPHRRPGIAGANSPTRTSGSTSRRLKGRRNPRRGFGGYTRLSRPSGYGLRGRDSRPSGAFPTLRPERAPAA